MKVTIERDGTEVQAEVTVFVPRSGRWTYAFKWEAGIEDYAGFLADAIETQFQDQIRAIREDAYNLGWEDKTKRRRKRTFFDYCFNARSMR